MDQEKRNTECVPAFEGHVGEVFEARRQSQQMTKARLVEAVQEADPRFSKTQLHRLLTGEAEWTLSRFVLVAQALGLDPSMLLDRILRGDRTRSEGGADAKAEQTDEA